MKIIIALDCSEIQVSDCDHLFLSAFNWFLGTCGYYRCSSCGILNGQQMNGLRLHRIVAMLMKLKIPDGYTIDHIDRNKKR